MARLLVKCVQHKLPCESTRHVHVPAIAVSECLCRVFRSVNLSCYRTLPGVILRRLLAEFLPVIAAQNERRGSRRVLCGQNNTIFGEYFAKASERMPL